MRGLGWSVGMERSGVEWSVVEWSGMRGLGPAGHVADMRGPGWSGGVCVCVWSGVERSGAEWSGMRGLGLGMEWRGVARGGAGGSGAEWIGMRGLGLGVSGEGALGAMAPRVKQRDPEGGRLSGRPRRLPHLLSRALKRQYELLGHLALQSLRGHLALQRLRKPPAVQWSRVAWSGVVWSAVEWSGMRGLGLGMEWRCVACVCVCGVEL